MFSKVLTVYKLNFNQRENWLENWLDSFRLPVSSKLVGCMNYFRNKTDFRLCCFLFISFRVLVHSAGGSWLENFYLTLPYSHLGAHERLQFCCGSLVIWLAPQVPGWSYQWTAAMAMIMAMERMGAWSTCLPHPPSTMETWRRSCWMHSMSQGRAAPGAAPTVTGEWGRSTREVQNSNCPERRFRLEPSLHEVHLLTDGSECTETRQLVGRNVRAHLVSWVK